MKCDELESYGMDDPAIGEEYEMYKVSDVDAAIAELKAENKLLKEHIANGDVSRITWIDEVIELKQKLDEKESWVKMLGEGEAALSLELEKTKQKLENVQASMYADVVDANMKIRRLQRALYKACANWAHFAVAFFSSYATKDKWRKMENKCRAKAEEYDNGLR